MTFVFTDIEESTRRSIELGDGAWARLLAEHHRILREAFAAGVEVNTEGDGFFVAFASAPGALHAAVSAQRVLQSHAWPEGRELRVRMGLHTGVALVRDNDYVGVEVTRASRVCDAGHGGQILLSEATAVLVGDVEPDGVVLVDLGLHQLKDLGGPQRLFTVEADGLAGGFGSPRSLEAVAKLPEPRTRLVGRDDDVRSVIDLLGSVRVVTLTGVGGVGKTRLALEVARRAREHGGQVVFADLSVVSDPGEVIDAVFAALRLPADARGGHLDGLVRVLGSRSAMLVLDNCEHVLDAVATMADRLTRDCPELRVLATSREAIDIDGEYAYHVPSLDLAAGVDLFVSSAAAAGSPHEPTAGEADIVEEICRRLDGIPLAIELAAARTSHLTPAAIAERLDERFWLLAGRRRALGRHQTLQATVDWSYDLLDEQARAVLRATAVFVGGFDADALAAVIERSDHDTLDHLGGLVGSSLVEVDHSGGQPRYRLLETIRLYAQDRLADADELATRRRAHVHHFLARALSQPPRFDDLAPWAPASVDDTDLGNYLAALDWLDRHDALADLGSLVARIPTVLGYNGYVDTDKRFLGREDVTAALNDLDERALYLTASAGNASYLGDFHDQFAYGEAALEVARDPVVRATAASTLANACTIFDPTRIPSLVDDALADLPATATMARQRLRIQPPLGLVMEGRLVEAADILAGLTSEGDGVAAAFGAAELMLVLYLLGEQERALAVPRPSDLSPQDGIWDYRWALVRALIAATERRPDTARQHLTDAADHIRSSPQRLLDTDVLLGCAALAYHTDDHRRASEILASFRGGVRSPASFAVYVHYRDLLKTRLSKPERTQALQRATHLEPTELLERELARTQSP